MKLVINKCYGGFGLSPEALEWLWEHGVRENASPINKYYGSSKNATKDINRWRTYKKTGKKDCFLTVFSPDEKYVLSHYDLPRDNPKLVECVEVLGDKANGDCAKLRVVEIPDGIEWEVDEYDGMESIEETHRSWG